MGRIRGSSSKSHRNCVVPGCSNRRDRCKWGLFPSEHKVAGRHVYVKRRLCGQQNCLNSSPECQAVRFPRIPKDSAKRRELRLKWLARIPRQNTPTSEHSCVCTVHFPGGVCDVRKDVPTIFADQPVLAATRGSKSSSGARVPPVVVVEEEKEEETVTSDVLLDHMYTDKSEPHMKELVRQQSLHIEGLTQKVASLQAEMFDLRAAAAKNRLSASRLCKELTTFRFYTGVSVETFRHILQMLGDAPAKMDYSGRKVGDHDGKRQQYTSRKLNLQDQLLLTLVKLRHNFPESDLGNRFGISQSSVSRIFTTWVLCLYHSFREVNIWPSRRLVNMFMPESFAKKYPSTRVVIDATEFAIEKPANPDVQAATWSSYKNMNTLKLLVGVTPNGVISFLSRLWGGRISDKELTKRSGLLCLLEDGDTIMADRGFDIESVMPAKTSVNIPPFLAGREQLDEDELVTTRRIATLRIHVERAMERIKNFTITDYFPGSLCYLAEPIVFVCAFLTIFDVPLVPIPASKQV